MAIAAIICGLIIVVWSADRFVDGSAALAKHLGIPPLLIGMLIVGFGTSAPEMAVSAIAAFSGNPGLAVGNAYGSNIANIGLILGLTALLSPIAVHSRVVRRELPLLLLATALAVALIADRLLSRPDALVLLFAFAGLMVWSVRLGIREPHDPLAGETAAELASHPLRPRAAIGLASVGLVCLLLGSQLLVWGAVELARALGISDLIIGLTIVAVGTSVPELASSLAAARKGESDIAIGNVIGSNLFNTLAVVGLAGVIAPVEIAPDVLYRDCAVMVTMTAALLAYFAWCRATGRGLRIGRSSGAILAGAYTIYLGALALQAASF